VPSPVVGVAGDREHTLYTRNGLRSIVFVGTYVPRRCGIATFTADLGRSVAAASGDARVTVTALNDSPEGYDYPPEVVFEVNQNHLREYRLAADYLNVSRVDVVCVQHEYGIFGGPDGRYILNLLAQLRMPVVTTLHTVLKDPSPGQKQVVCELAAASDRLVVMTETAREFLADVYGVHGDIVDVIPHGIPDVPSWIQTTTKTSSAWKVGRLF